MKVHNKRWLMSVMKTSGSKRERVANGNYSDERHLVKQFDLDDLPQHEGIKSTMKLYNGKVNFGLLVRFLRGSVGNDWDDVYSEIISRIPTKLLDYKDSIFWFVANKIEIKDGKIWNKKTQSYIWREEDKEFLNTLQYPQFPEFKEFYVDPNTNILIHVPQKSFKRLRRP